MVSMKLFVEGGGDSHLLKTACRKGFSDFLRKAGLAGRMPRILACGGRQNAYDDFCTALANGEPALLLVDSESPLEAKHQQGKPEEWKPWQHLLNRAGDKWQKPDKAGDDDCHLMVQCMEAWFLADRNTLQSFFGQGFSATALPAAANKIETIAKKQIFDSLANATKDCKTKAEYGKGEHSFKLLSLIDPAKVTVASPWAGRFVDNLKEKMKV